ncbi:hypothetical protein [Kitasatospora sp. NPDC088346]|uniref:hypothetical protein n=1 Tax=Kitasatospora sp. NPDC088346 TaxID=3364073 RepID=UPI0037F212D0
MPGAACLASLHIQDILMASRDKPVFLPPAAYLRYHPRSSSHAPRHLEAIRHFAARLGLPAPVFFVDEGYPSSGIPPRLEQLVRAVADGSHRVILVPGRWVFSGDDVRARRIISVLTRAGCQRILTLPASRRP